MPKLPVAGLLRRVPAFIIDFIILSTGLHLVIKSMHGVFFRLGEWTPYITAGIALAYFVCFNGPWGGGRTIGKIITRTMVTDYLNNPPTWRQAFIRTIVLMPFFASVPLFEAIVGRPSSVMESFLQYFLCWHVTLAVMISALLVIPFNPFKQGPHDFLARTLVRTHAPDLPTFQEMASSLGVEWRVFHRQPQYSGVATIVLILALLGALTYPGNLTPGTKELLNAAYAMSEGMGLSNADVSRQAVPEAIYNARTPEEHNTAIANESGESSGTLRLIVAVTNNKPWSFAEGSPEEDELATRIVEQYHHVILPKLIAEQLLSQNPDVKARASRWTQRGIVYKLDLGVIISTFPDIFPLSESHFSNEKPMPPVVLPNK